MDTWVHVARKPFFGPRVRGSLGIGEWLPKVWPPPLFLSLWGHVSSFSRRPGFP